MYNIIALMGKAGAGKDALLKRIIAEEPHIFNEIISTTTRPARENEVQGKNYHFVSEDIFKNYIDDGLMLEWTIFRNWYYGTSLNSLNSGAINIGVFNPTGVRTLMQLPTVKVTPIYVVATDKTRIIRQMERETNPDVKEILRRYEADEKDFKDIEYAFNKLVLLNNENAITDTVNTFFSFGQKNVNY